MPDHGRFVPDPEPPADEEPAEERWFLFRGAELLVWRDEVHDTLPHGLEALGLGAAPLRRLYVGRQGGVWYRAAELDREAAVPAGGEFLDLRSLWGLLSESLWAVAGRAAQLLAWERDHQFCGRCGTPTFQAPGERARKCPACGLLSFPRISPAVITLVERGDRILLARSPHFAPGRYGIIAGFVEAGESLEEAVHREIAEEVGIVVSDLRYFGSQAWPFPHGIMLGFNARWAEGELAPDPGEIVDAGWFGIDDLPLIPAKLSIARRLIDDWADRHGFVIPDSAT